MPFGQGLVESFLHASVADDRAYFQQSAEYDHVEHLSVFHLRRLVHGVDAIDVDVASGGRIEDAVAVVDEYSAWLHLWLKLLERWLVEHHGDVVSTEYGRGDLFVAHDDGDVSRSATLFRSVGRHPCHFLSLHESGVGEDLAH